jgi:hypothetical protein
MRSLTGGNAKYVIQAGNAGAVDAVVAVLRGHSGTAVLQAFACFTKSDRKHRIYDRDRERRRRRGRGASDAQTLERSSAANAGVRYAPESYKKSRGEQDHSGERGRHRGCGCGDAHARVSCRVASEGL